MPHPFNLTAAASADLTAEQYIADRLEQYQSWYDGKARKTKVRYLRMRTATVVGGACVPALVNLDFQYVRVLTTLASLVVVVLVSLESVFHYREQWKNYRSTEQVLGHEKVFYRVRTGSYEGLNDRDAFRLLVDRTEGAIAAENSATLNVMTISSEEAITAGK
jgi:hypothetical protein